MNGFEEFVTVAGAVILLLMLLGAGAALVRGSYSKARIQALREDNEDLRNRVSDVENSLIAEREKSEQCMLRITAMEAEKELLKQLVTQRADVEQVMTMLQNHFNTSDAQLSHIIEILEGRTPE